VFVHVRLTLCSRENTVLRGQLLEESESDPHTLSVRKNIYVIPNAIIADHFKPNPVANSAPQTSDDFSSRVLMTFLTFLLVVTIVVISRLAYRKGIDLLVATAPRICAAFPNVRFLVGELIFILNPS
jgi:phosphatidylinositol glycan class A protein